ncbi:hypothetical protein Vretifemale_8729, partial [Volvox reticuliferus]
VASSTRRLASPAAAVTMATQPAQGRVAAGAKWTETQQGHVTSRTVAQCPAASLFEGTATDAVVTAALRGSTGGGGQGSVAPAGASGQWCSCTPGWGGAACSRCLDGWPLACASLLPQDPKATCVSSLGYDNRTLYKVYSCNVEESMSRFLLSLEVCTESIVVSGHCGYQESHVHVIIITVRGYTKYGALVA